MVEVLRKSLIPLLLAGGLAALGGCSGHQSGATTAPTESYGGPCTVGPTAGNNLACDATQDQADLRSQH